MKGLLTLAGRQLIACIVCVVRSSWSNNGKNGGDKWVGMVEINAVTFEVCLHNGGVGTYKGGIDRTVVVEMTLSNIVEGTVVDGDIVTAVVAIEGPVAGAEVRVVVGSAHEDIGRRFFIKCERIIVFVGNLSWHDALVSVSEHPAL